MGMIRRSCDFWLNPPLCFLDCLSGGEAVAREDIMEAIERAKYGINDKEVRSRTLGNELSKLFPWMPSLARKNGPDQDGLQGPLGYQTLS